MSDLKLQEAKEKVKNQEDTIQSLINPEDLIHQDIESWDNVDIDMLKEEIGSSMGDAWTYGINHPYGNMIEQLAIDRYVENMTKLPMKHLNPEIFEGIEDMVVNGYWPYQTSREEIEELVYEWKEDIEYFYEYESEIRMEIEDAIMEARLEEIEE